MNSLDSTLAVVLDVGTTNIRVVVFNKDLTELYVKERGIETKHPQPGYAEQDPAQILSICKELLAEAEEHTGTHPTLVGITNQRESVVAWDKSSGKALSPLILWSDKRTEEYCDSLKRRGLEDAIRYKTGLLLTPYSSAPKIHWLLQQPAAQACRELAVGTLDSWLVFSLTGKFLTDYTNASRTMLYNIHTQAWDEELLSIFGVTRSVLPFVQPSKHDFGSYATNSTHMAHHIRAVVGDQQASLFAAGTALGTSKITYGTGIFPMHIIGDKFELKDDLLTTLAIGPDGEPIYALEGKVENAAPRVSKVYGIDKSSFDKLMLELAHEATPVIHKVIDEGSEVFADGGISQNDDILAEQERLNHIHLHRMRTHNGTALGVAKLLFWNE